jgi:hypothetical protein
MLRKFTKDVGRYKTGALHDYPKHVWAQIEADARKAGLGKDLNAFSESIETNTALQSMLKGRQPAFPQRGSR